MSSSITTFIATAILLFTLGHVAAETAREAAHPPERPTVAWGVPAPSAAELPSASR